MKRGWGGCLASILNGILILALPVGLLGRLDPCLTRFLFLMLRVDARFGFFLSAKLLERNCSKGIVFEDGPHFLHFDEKAASILAQEILKLYENKEKLKEKLKQDEQEAEENRRRNRKRKKLGSF